MRGDMVCEDAYRSRDHIFFCRTKSFRQPVAYWLRKSGQGHPSVDADISAGDEAAGVGCQEERSARQFFGCQPVRDSAH
jgi:hypothetical protein